MSEWNEKCKTDRTFPAESSNGPPRRAPVPAARGASSVQSVRSASRDERPRSDVPGGSGGGGGGDGAVRRSSSSCAMLASWVCACAYASLSRRTAAVRHSSSLSCSSLKASAKDAGVEGGSSAAMRSKSVGEVSGGGKGT